MGMFLKCACFLLIAVLLGGCWDRTELNDLAIITALALDKEESGQIRTTVQIVIPQNQGGSGPMGGGGGGGAAKRTTVRSEKGINTSDALSKLQGKTPRKLFWGHCTVFIYSKELAESGIGEQFDIMVRHPQFRERADIFVSEGKAADALDLFPPIEHSSAEVLQKLSDLNTGIRVTLEQLSIMLKDDSQAASLPIVKILPPAKSSAKHETIPYVIGTAVFKKDKMIGEIPEKATRGIMWIKNKIKEYTVTFQAGEEGELVSLRPVKASVKLIPKIKGDRWMMTIRVQTEGDIVQNGSMSNPMNKASLAQLDKQYENYVKERIEQALGECQTKLKADIIDFAGAFHRKYPKHWKKNKDRWNELFPEVEVKIEVTATILRPGLVNTPGGMPKEEVRDK